MYNHKIKQVEDYAKSLMSAEIAHDFEHVQRVRVWALRIAKNEHFTDLEAVEMAALLHDIGLSSAESRSRHGEVGAELAANNLLAPAGITEVCQAIKYHSKNREGSGKLLEILRDADMMDMFGAMGIMRAYTSKAAQPAYDAVNIKGETWQMSAQDFDRRFDEGLGIGHFIIDQINFQISCFDNLSTDSAKALARPLVDFMKKFILELAREVVVKNSD
jgi:HD superfamily phosphodiesterase